MAFRIEKKYILNKTFAGAVGMGIFLGIVNAYLDTFIFFAGPGTFWDFLIFDVPVTEALARTLVLFLFIIFGYLLSKKEHELQQNKAVLDYSLDRSPESVYWLNRKGCFFYVNQRAVESLGYSEHEFDDLNVFDLFRHTTHCSPEMWEERWIELRKKKTLLFESRLTKKDGTIIEVEILANLTAHNGEEYMVCFLRDISARMAQEKEIRVLNKLIDAANEPIIVSDPDTLKILYVNEKTSESLGYSKEELLHMHTDGIKAPSVHDMDFKHQMKALREKGAMYAFETLVRKDGSRFPSKSNLKYLEIDDQRYLIAFIRDISLEKELQRQIIESNRQLRDTNERLAMSAAKDYLTDIFNRSSFNEFLTHELAELRRYNHGLCVIFCDLDHFKRVNDQYGHAVGDMVLKTFVKIVQKNIRRSDILARWGGEEFIILLPRSHSNDAMNVAEKIRANTEAYPFDTIGTITASFGVVEANQKDTKETLFDKVDAALYRAKKEGRNRVCI